MLKAMKLTHGSTIFLPIEPAAEMVDKDKAVTNMNDITRTTDDDMIFKKPTTAPSSTFLHSYFHSLPSNDSVLQLNQKLKKQQQQSTEQQQNKEKLSSQSDSSNLFLQLKKIKQGIGPHQQQGANAKEEKTLNDWNLSAVSYRQTELEQKDEKGHSLTDLIEVQI